MDDSHKKGPKVCRGTVSTTAPFLGTTTTDRREHIYSSDRQVTVSSQ
jgi:hypothetical protein